MQSKIDELMKYQEQQQIQQNIRLNSKIQAEQVDAYRNEIEVLKRENENMMQILIKR
jgi:hypothetical protein